MRTITKRYKLKFDEINQLAQKIYISKDIKRAVKDFEDLLIDAYIEGSSAANYILGTDFTPTEDEILEAISKEYDGISISDKLAMYYETGTLEELQRLAESEWHRVYNEASLQVARQSGRDLIKIWHTMEDDKVREPHEWLDGVSAPLEGKFYSEDDEAEYPGGFKSARLNANCRCFLTYEDKP